MSKLPLFQRVVTVALKLYREIDSDKNTDKSSYFCILIFNGNFVDEEKTGWN